MSRLRDLPTDPWQYADYFLPDKIERRFHDSGIAIYWEHDELTAYAGDELTFDQTFLLLERLIEQRRGEIVDMELILEQLREGA
jgi:hypothetical protein